MFGAAVNVDDFKFCVRKVFASEPHYLVQNPAVGDPKFQPNF